MIPARFEGNRMKPFIEGTDRGQSTLFPECLEDWIGEDNLFVRAIEVFVTTSILPSLGSAGSTPR
jgi:hypothetical protein